MTKIRIFLFISAISLLGLASCGDEGSDPASQLELVRFDRLLMALDSTDFKNSFDQLEKNYPDFCQIFFMEVLPIPGYVTKNDSFYVRLQDFVNDDRIRDLYDRVQKQYPDFKEEIKAMDQAMEKAKRWFPETENPRVYTFISEFGYQRFIFDDAGQDGLAIGLDLFLEPEFDYSVLESGSNSFSRYLTRTYNKDHLVKKTMDAWLEDKMGLVQGDRLVDHMIYNGIKLNILEDILEVPDSVLTEYPQEKLEWLENNEKEMWSFYFQNDWFYSTDQYVIKRLIQPAPNSTALQMPAAAPGQTANYLGWKIVKSYLKRFPESDVEKLLTDDAQKILEASRFKPGSNP